MNPAEFANIALSERDFWWYRGMRKILFGMLDPFLAGRKITRALEAGCGTGYFSHLLQSERRLPVVPADISWEGLRYARKMGAERPVQANILDLPFAAGSFDMVLSIDVLAHLQEGEEHRACGEFARVLRPGGLLVIRASALDILRSRHSQFAFERQRFTRRRLMGMAAASGVRMLRCSYANSLLLPAAFAKFRIWEPLMRRPPASGVQPVAPWLDRLFYGALALEAAWLARGYRFPAGQSLVFIGEKMV